MITCPNCNNVNSPTERFCTRCGKPLAASGASIPPTQVSPMLRGSNKGKTQVMPPPSPASGNSPRGFAPQNNTEITPPKPAPRASGVKNKTQIFNPNKAKPVSPAHVVVANNMISNTGESPLVGFLICRDFNGDRNGVFWPLRTGRTYIGRDPSESQIVLPFDNISGAHAVIIFRPNGKNWISDNNSQNGTYVDGEDIGPDKVALQSGSQIQIGDVCFDILLYDQSVAST